LKQGTDISHRDFEITSRSVSLIAGWIGRENTSDAAFCLRGGACPEVGGHDIQGLVPVREDWVLGAHVRVYS